MKRTKQNKRTFAQLAQQKRFALAMRFLSPLKDIINEGFSYVTKRKRRQLYPFNLAMSQVLRVAITDGANGLGIDPEQVWLSDGNLPRVQIVDLIADTDRIVVYYCSGTSSGDWDDRVRLIAYQAEEGVAVRSQELAIRSDGQVVLTVPQSLLGKPLYLYILCHDRDGERYARSQYLGTYQIQ